MNDDLKIVIARSTCDEAMIELISAATGFPACAGDDGHGEG